MILKNPKDRPVWLDNEGRRVEILNLFKAQEKNVY